MGAVGTSESTTRAGVGAPLSGRVSTPASGMITWDRLAVMSTPLPATCSVLPPHSCMEAICDTTASHLRYHSQPFVIPQRMLPDK